MMRTLTLDASMADCAAGWVDGDTLLGELRAEGDLASLPGLVERLLREWGRHLDLVAVTVGPGSFTGLRASIALAHGVGLAAGAPVVGVTVGAALSIDGPCWAAIDSKRGRVFLERDGAVEVVALDRLPLPPGPIVLGGDAAMAVGEALASRGASVTLLRSPFPHPLGIARAAQLHPRPALPLYVEPPAAREGPAGRPAPA